MEKKTITFSANEQKLIKTGGMDCYASNTVAYIEAHFDLGENWSGYDSVRAVWWNDYNKTVATVLDSEGTCIVPYEVLTHKSAVKVNLVGSIAENDVLTDRLTTCPVVALTIKCNAKTDGDNTQPITPSQFERFVQNVKADADRAEAGATASAQSAQSASESATASANSATSSEQSATASAESAQNASESAQSAETAKDDAESARDEILGMRATAETLEAGSDATASYDNGVLTLGIPRGDQGIQGIQGETGATPNLTIGTVETLEPTEDATASITGTAENPVLNLGLPKGDTGEVSLEDLEALLPTDTASGDIVTIPDGQSVIPAESLKVALSPIQDLNGYDKPWVGGAGVNLLPPAPAKTATSGGITYTSDGNGKITVSGTRTGTSFIDIELDNAVTMPSGNIYIHLLNNFATSQVAFVFFNGNTQLTYVALTTTNRIVDVSSWLSGATFDKVRVFTNDAQNYNGSLTPMLCTTNAVIPFEPYSNICPISGRTEVATSLSPYEQTEKHTITGKNLYNAPNNQSGVLVPCHIENGQTVVASCGGSGAGIRYYNANKTQIDYWTLTLQANGRYYRSFTASGGIEYVEFYGAGSTNYMIEVGVNAPSPYEPYGTTYTTSLGQTVYGGTLDVVAGELVVDRAMVDLGTLNWVLETSEYSNNRFRSASEFGVKRTADQTSSANILCSVYPTGKQAWFGDKNIDKYVSGLNWYSGVSIVDSSYTDATAFKTAMNGVQLVYELANPQTIQLTPQQVQLLLGTNNIWSDGKVTLTYNADIQRWVEKKLNGNSTTLTMSRPMVQTETTEETETETAETE